MTNTRVDMPIHCPHHTVRAWTVDAKCSWCEIAELRAEIERLQTALDAETPSIEVVYEPPADEPRELRPPVRLEDYGPVIDEIAPVSKDVWDSLKSVDRPICGCTSESGCQHTPGRTCLIDHAK